MKDWPSKYKISKYKERFQYICGSTKKREEINMNNNTNIWNGSGTNFSGSAYRGKQANIMKV